MRVSLLYPTKYCTSQKLTKAIAEVGVLYALYYLVSFYNNLIHLSCHCAVMPSRAVMQRNKYQSVMNVDYYFNSD